MSDMLTGFVSLFTISNFLLVNIGLLLGIVFGAIPGLGIILAIIIFSPMTFGMAPTGALLMLLGIYCGGTYGGSISAILINTPGTPNSAATLLDGYPAAKNGNAQKALDMSLYASTISGLISVVILIMCAPQLARITLLFGAPEFFSLALFGLAVIISVSGKNLLKGVIAGCLGLFLATIGLDPVSGITTRFTFDSVFMMGGIEQLVLLIGLFAITELINKANYTSSSKQPSVSINSRKRLGIKELIRSGKTIVRSSLLGTGIGAIPGTGGVLAALLSYDLAKKRSKNPDSYGKGNLDGVAAAEAGNNGITGATLIPLFTLGIPGDGVTAILLGSLMIHGLIPGPNLFTASGPVVYSIMFGLIFVNIFMLLQGRVLARLFTRIIDIPYSLLVPAIIIFCTAGTYSIRNSPEDIMMMMAVGLSAYVMLKLDFPLVPVLLGFVLGPIAEDNFRRSMALSKGSYHIFLTNPISLCFILISISVVLFALFKSYKESQNAKSNETKHSVHYG